ncbi:MAG TPA: exodeoxyribonuclease III [Spirochaetaceae bacterium]|nr:exodeoxyribonuclease III [Spirochaetaceae bacterium]
MKLISYNVNGVRSCMKKGLADFLLKENADIVMLQEVKASADQADLGVLAEKYEVIWNPARRKGYSGTALLAKNEPIGVNFGIPDFDGNEEGRVIAAEFDDFFAVCVYTPNSKAELARLDYRQEWDAKFSCYISLLSRKKNVICAGDFNVAYEKIDLARPDSNHFNPGFSDEERAGFSKILERGFVDTFRKLYPEKQEYSWFSYKTAARERGVGWRIDYFLVSQGIADRIEDSYIINSEYSSDHLPICLILK